MTGSKRRSSNVGVSRPDTTSSQPTIWSSSNSHQSESGYALMSARPNCLSHRTTRSSRFFSILNFEYGVAIVPILKPALGDLAGAPTVSTIEPCDRRFRTADHFLAVTGRTFDRKMLKIVCGLVHTNILATKFPACPLPPLPAILTVLVQIRQLSQAPAPHLPS